MIYLVTFSQQITVQRKKRIQEWQWQTLTLEASNFVLIFAILNAFCKLAGGQKMLHFLTIKNAFRRQSCTQMIGWDSGNWTRRVVFIF